MATAQAQLLQQHIGGLIVLGVLQLPAVLTLPSSRCVETVVSPMPLLFNTNRTMYREAPANFDPRLTRCDHHRSASEIEVVCVRMSY